MQTSIITATNNKVFTTKPSTDGLVKPWGSNSTLPHVDFQ